MTTGTSPLRTEIVHSEERFRALADAWRDLHEQSGSRSIFLSCEWLHGWWRHFGSGRALWMGAAFEGERLVGMAPLCIETDPGPARLRSLCFLGTERVSSDYLDLLLLPTRCDEIAAALWRALFEGPRPWDVLRLSDMLDDSWVQRLWTPAFQRADYRTRVTPAQVCPYLALPTSVEDLLQQIPSGTRSSYRKKCRYLARLQPRFESEDQTARLPAALERLYALHAKRWASKGQRGTFHDPRVLAFHDDIVARLAPLGRARIHELRVDDRTIASLYEFSYRDVATYYQAGFDPEPPGGRLAPWSYSPGGVILGGAIEAAVRRGAGEFDFLRGPEPYKWQWTHTYRRTRTLHAVPPTHWKGRVALSLERSVTAVKELLKRALGRDHSDGIPPEAVAA